MPILRLLLRLIALAAISLTVLLLLGRFHWFLEMLTHFRLPFALALIPLVAVLFFAKHWKIGTAVAACLLLQIIPLSHHYLPFTKDTRVGTGPTLKIVTFNVLTSNPKKQEVLTFLQGTDADILCLQEISKEWLEKLKPLHAQYPHSVSYPRNDNFGLLVFSKHPITNHHIEPEKLGTPYLTTKIDWQGKNLTVITAHPLPPMKATTAASQRATLQRIYEDASRIQTPLIVVGDFNSTAYSPSFQPLKKILTDSAKGRGYAATWNRGHPLLGIPIDQILHSSHLVSRDRQIGPKCGSDHSPLITTLQLR